MKASFELRACLGPLALLLLLTGCGARAYEGGGDSNSNWLKACDPDANCGSGLECLCGICTMQCASNRTCGEDEEATCDVPAGCEQPVTICTPREKHEADADTSDSHNTEGGKSTDTTDDSRGDTVTDTTVVDTVTDTTTGDTRVDDSDRVSDTTTGETGVDVSDATTPVATDAPRTVDVPTGPTTAPTGTGTTTSTNTTAESSGTTGGGETTVPEEVGDPQCSSAACLDGNLCFEPTGRHCECPARAELASCEGLLFQTLAMPNNLQSCVSRAVSGDGASVVGMCQVVDGPNLAVMWGPDGASVVIDVDGDLTHGLGITDDGLTSYWLSSDGSTVAQNDDVQSRHIASAAEGFTPDGSVIVGRQENDVRGSNAFRWTEATGTQLMQALYDAEPRDAALAVSADGQTSVGYANTSSGQRPVRWNTTGEIEELPLLDGVLSGQAVDVSADGSVIVGGGAGHALRWTSNGVQSLLQMDDGINEARLVTRDGTRVFGLSLYGAWMWDETNGVQSLQALLGMDERWTITSIADVSADGTTIVGSAQLSNDFSPWRWFAFRGRLPAP